MGIIITYAEKFKKDRYVYIENVLSEDECDEALRYLINDHKSGYSTYGQDSLCPNSICFPRNNLYFLQERKKSFFEDILGLKLVPTYNYSRIYKPGEKLPKHVDRYACEISVTVTIGYIGQVWPIYFLDRNDSAENMYYHMDQTQYTHASYGDKAFSPFIDTSNKLKFDIKKGDGVFYRGCELTHWRDEYVEGEEQAQVFFHFVNANGPYKDLNTQKNIYTIQDFKNNAGII